MAESIGKIYADALSELCIEENNLEEVYSELSDVIKVFSQAENGEFGRILYGNTLGSEEKKQMLTAVFAGRLSDISFDFLCLLADKKRLRYFPEIFKDFTEIYNEKMNIVEVTSVTAQPLPEDLREKLIEKLKKVTGKNIVLQEKVDKSVMGGISLSFPGKELDGTVRTRLDRLKSTERSEFVMKLRPDEITGLIKQQIKNYHNTVSMEDSGKVCTVGDGISRVNGLEKCMSGELLEFSNGTYGMAMNLEQDFVGCVLLGSEDGIKEGSEVKRTGKIVSVPVGEALLGRVVNALGAPIDGKGAVLTNEYRPVESPAFGIITRKSVSRPLQTGIKAIDSMIPIGRGQRELIIGDRQTGKTTIALDTIINQKGKDVICIYVAIGQKRSTVANVVDTLTKNGAMDYSIVVAATASETAPLQYIAPYAGVSMAEYFMLQGKDVLCVYDDLSKHAVAYRTMSLLLRRPTGREAYPGDVFYLHSRLLERACCLNEENGGGSITALPVIETQAGDVSAYIPTNVISITDGQIFLETELFFSGVRPAVNPGISVSRVGGSAQIKAMKKVSGSLKLLYSQYKELQSFSQFGSDLDNDTKQRLAQGERIVEVLKQGKNSPVDVEKQVVIIYAVTNNYLKDIKVEDIREFETELFEHLDTVHPEILQSIRETKDLTEENEKAMKEVLESFAESFLKSR